MLKYPNTVWHRFNQHTQLHMVIVFVIIKTLTRCEFIVYEVHNFPFVS